METKKTALVLGATGSIGRAVAEALLARGWVVRGLARHPEMARVTSADHQGIEWLGGDAMQRDTVVAAAQGTQAIVHAVSPVGYRDWDQLVLPMIDNTIAAARAAGGARVLLPGTVYNFDPVSTPVVCEASPQLSPSRKGRIRAELERRLEAASQDVPALIVRAGDYFGPQVRSSWFAQAMVRPGRPVKRLMTLPRRGVGHTWAYLPDLADAMARLLDHPGLRRFEQVGFEGFWDEDGRALPALVAEALGRERLPEMGFPWWLMQLASPMGGFPSEAVDILPFWRHPMQIDNARMVALLGAEPRTPPLQAMRHTLRGPGCLPGGAPARGDLSHIGSA